MAIKLSGKKFNKDNTVKNLVRGHKLVTHLDKAIKDFDEPWSYTYEPKPEDDAWHPSGDCIPSIHDLWLKAVHPEKRDFGVSTMKNFQVGHFFHQYLQHILTEKLGLATPEAIERRGTRGWGHTSVSTVRELESGERVPWAPYHWATGSADVAPCTVPGHGDYLIDIKTMNSMAFKRNYPPPGFAEKWECQVNIYLDWFDLERALIVGVQKDTPHEMKEFEYHRNQPLIDAIYEKWYLVSDCLDAGIEPPVDEEHPLLLVGPVETK